MTTVMMMIGMIMQNRTIPAVASTGNLRPQQSLAHVIHDSLSEHTPSPHTNRKQICHGLRKSYKRGLINLLKGFGVNFMKMSAYPPMLKNV